jgi:hypothetical protein
VHDGFYLRMGAGLGGGRASISTDTDSSASAPNFVVGGAGLGLNLWIGGTPWNGIAIGGMISGQGFSDGDVRVEGDRTDEGMDGSVGMLGMFIDAFPDAQRGLHFGGALGLAGISAQADSQDFEDATGVGDFESGGLGASMWVGYMGFVGAEWSLGGMLQLTGAVTRKEEDRDLPGGGSETLIQGASAYGVTLSFTALYH